MVIGVIPARIGSSRFPKKILADIEGMPMVAHVAKRALKAKKLDKVIIAIDAEETKNALSNYEFELFMTKPSHISGTDRIAEVVSSIEDVEIIINIQGDEPLLDPGIIDGLIDLFDDPSVSMGTVVSRNIGVHDYLDRNIVKVFLDENLVMNYSGVTFDWKGQYTGSLVRIGVYRDSGRRKNITYPSQSIHFDNFIIVSDKKVLDNYLK